MPLFKVDIEKVYANEYWSNVYYLELDVLDGALTVANEIVAAERAIHKNFVLFTKVRVSDMIPGTDEYITGVLNVTGLATSESTLLPLWNVVRVDLTATAGRPSRKYLRGCIAEDNMSYDNLDPAFVTFINNNYVTPLVLIEELKDVDGQDLVDGACMPKVGMRQLRRGSRRRTTPIIP